MAHSVYLHEIISKSANTETLERTASETYQTRVLADTENLRLSQEL